MAKFVTFDDGCGTYNFRAVFPSKTSKYEIRGAVVRKLLRNLRSRGLDKEDMPSKAEINEFITIRNFRDGCFYEPNPYERQWND